MVTLPTTQSTCPGSKFECRNPFEIQLERRPSPNTCSAASSNPLLLPPRTSTVTEGRDGSLTIAVCHHQREPRTEHAFTEGTRVSLTVRPQHPAPGPTLFWPFTSSHTHPTVFKNGYRGKRPTGLESLAPRMLSSAGPRLLPIIRTILFLALSLSSFKNSPRVNSSNCFLTERKAQPDECFLCSSLKKKKSQHKGRSTEKVQGAERQPLTSGPFPSLRHPRSASRAKRDMTCEADGTSERQVPKPHSHTARLSACSLCGRPARAPSRRLPPGPFSRKRVTCYMSPEPSHAKTLESPRAV